MQINAPFHKVATFFPQDGKTKTLLCVQFLAACKAVPLPSNRPESGCPLPSSRPESGRTPPVLQTRNWQPPAGHNLVTQKISPPKLTLPIPVHKLTHLALAQAWPPRLRFLLRPLCRPPFDPSQFIKAGWSPGGPRPRPGGASRGTRGARGGTRGARGGAEGRPGGKRNEKQKVSQRLRSGPYSMGYLTG
jgi:hypothetical protein